MRNSIAIDSNYVAAEKFEHNADRNTINSAQSKIK